MSRFFWKTPSHIYIALGMHQHDDILRLIRTKDPIPKRSVKTGSLLASRCAENRHSDFVGMAAPKAVDWRSALAPAFDA